MTRFERAFRRRFSSGVVTGYNEIPADRREATAQLLVHLRSIGCTCSAEIEMPEVPQRGKLTNTQIKHDPDCWLVRTGKVA